MPGIREVLQFVLEADASGAVKGFESVAAASDKSLGKSEKSAQSLGTTMSKVGAVVTGAGIAVGAGLVGTVKAFEKSEASAEKFATAVKGMGSGIDTARIQKLAFQLQQVSTVTDNQVVAAARWGAVYGLTTAQLEKLLRVAVDLSAQTGQSLDATTKALARAATGGSDKVLTKWGLQLDETARKADAFGTTVDAAMAFAGGAAAKHANTFSGQLTRMGNNWTDVKEKIGAGANEVFEPLARGAANLSEKVAELNPQLLKTIGHFAAVGSVGATAFGTLATLGGQLANIREGFSGIGGVAGKAFAGIGLPLKDAEGNATKFASGLGKVAGAAGMVAGGTVAIYEIATAIDKATQNAVGLDTALKKAATANTGRELASALKAAGDAGTGFFEKIQKGVSGEIIYKIAGVEIGARKLSVAMGDLESKDPATALAALDLVVKELKKDLDGTTDPKRREQLKGDIKGYEEHRKELAANVKATEDAANATGDLTKGLMSFADALKPTNGALGLFTIRAGEAEAASKGFATAAEGFDTDEQVTSAVKLGDAFHGVEDSVKNLPHHFDDTKASLGGYNEEQSKAITAVTDWGDAAKAHIQAMVETSGVTTDVAAKSVSYSNALKAVMVQSGMTDAQANAYLDTLGLTPEQVLTEIKLAGDADAKFRLGFLQGQMDDLDEGVQAEVRQQIIMGDYQGALATAQNGMQNQANRNPITQPIKFAFASGLPSPFPVGGRPAGKAAPGTAPAGMAVAAPAAYTAPVTNITVTLPAGSTPSTTLAAIRRYQRLGGDMGGLLDTVAAIR